MQMIVDYAEKPEISENLTSNYIDTGSNNEDVYDDINGAEWCAMTLLQLC